MLKKSCFLKLKFLWKHIFSQHKARRVLNVSCFDCERKIYELPQLSFIELRYEREALVCFIGFAIL